MAALGGLAVLTLGAWLVSRQPGQWHVPEFLAFHIVLETASILVAGLAFAVGREGLRDESPGPVSLLAAGFLGVGLLDFAHMVSFKGMPDFCGPGDPEKAIAFWLMARFVAGLALLAAAFLPARLWPRRRHSGWLYLGVLVLAASGYWVGFFYWQNLPHTFIPGKGLTALKLALEYILIGINALAALGFWRNRRSAGDGYEPLLLFAATVVMAFSEFLFTLYGDVTDVYIFMGHILKVVAYGFVYFGIFVANVRRPYHRLEQAFSELEAANLQLTQADRHKDEFLSVISHELRTPLNFIMGFSSLLEAGIGGDLNETQRTYIARISRGSDRMLSLVTNLLEVSAMQAGRFSIFRGPASMADLLGETEADLAAVATEKGVVLRTQNLVDGILDVDGRRISSVIHGLVENAVRFTPEGGTVTVQASAGEGQVLVEVVDTGPGIPPESIPRLFKPFSQLDMSSTRRDGGAGLGLVICKFIVEAHGGQVGVRSEPGLGSTFWFSLPATVGDDQSTTPASVL